MTIIYQRITISSSRKPDKHKLNDALQWFGESLGLFSTRDKDNSCFRLFIELLKAARHEIPMTSDDLAFRLNLSRGTIVHHLNKLIESGIVVNEGNKYILRVNNLEVLVDELEQDLARMCTDLRKVAREIDTKLG